MPDMDGIELLREIKRRRLRPKAIMVSSFTSQGAQVTTDALMEGAFDFILKPSGNDSNANRQQLRDALQQKISAFRESSDSEQTWHPHGRLETTDRCRRGGGGGACRPISLPSRDLGNVDRRPRGAESRVAQTPRRIAGPRARGSAHAGEVHAFSGDATQFDCANWMWSKPRTRWKRSAAE